MKKVWMSLVVLFVAIHFTGCVFIAEKEVGKQEDILYEQENVEENKDTDNEVLQEGDREESKAETTPSKEIEGTLIDTEYYTLEVPKSWDGKYCYHVTDREDNIYFFTISENISYSDLGGGGMLFSIMLQPGGEDYTFYPRYDILGSFTSDEIGSFNIVVRYPSDVQFSERGQQTYEEMRDGIEDVLDSISFKEGYVYSETPIPIQN